ncbi:MAG TPA: hypothetical protein VGM14_16240 [Streptosporangiaceae bacterium]
MRTSWIPGLSPRGKTVLALLEHRRLWPGAAAQTLRLYAQHVRHPYHRLYDPRYEGCGYWECCSDPCEVRQVLEIVAAALPRRDARQFRRRLRALDDAW